VDDLVYFEQPFQYSRRLYGPYVVARKRWDGVGWTYSLRYRESNQIVVDEDGRRVEAVREDNLCLAS